MTSNHIRSGIFILVFTSIQCLNLVSQTGTPEVISCGSMRGTMWEGKTGPAILLDTLTDGAFLYGLGPGDQLKGEWMIYGGQAWLSRVGPDSLIDMTPGFSGGAPFFVYARVRDWQPVHLPDTVRDLGTLGSYLDQKFPNLDRAFPFRLEGMVKQARIHLVNLPAGARVESPEDAHRGIVHYSVSDQPCHLLGFFSRQHQGVFIHHDSYIHTHLMSLDGLKMGHLEEARWDPNALILFLPAGLP